jgi:hypothetical protein
MFIGEAVDMGSMFTHVFHMRRRIHVFHMR